MARILVIDDCQPTREAVTAMMEHEGHEVAVAGDGIEGSEAYRSGEFDLVITDIVMPRQDGIETIMDLWRDFPDVKVIAISGGSQHAEPEFVLNSARIFGALRTFTKPLHRTELVSAVNELLAV